MLFKKGVVTNKKGGSDENAGRLTPGITRRNVRGSNDDSRRPHPGNQIICAEQNNKPLNGVVKIAEEKRNEGYKRSKPTTTASGLTRRT